MSKSEINKKYYEKHKDKILKYRSDWYQKNKKKNDDYHRLWYQKNLEKNRDQRRESARKIRHEMIALLGGKCLKCGFSDWRALQIDHINGGGSLERKSLGHCSWSLYKKIKQNLLKYQLLCANCNWIKRYENKESFWKIKYEQTS